MSGPLALAHPTLCLARSVTTWHDLPTLVEVRDVGSALQAWAELAESFGDSTGAAIHHQLYKAVAEARERGVAPAFSAAAKAVRDAQTPWVREFMTRIDAAFLRWLLGDAAGLTDAEDFWVDEARTGRIESLPLPLRLSLYCDGVALHDAVLQVRPNEPTLSYFVGLLERVVSMFRDFNEPPPFCRLHLDPRLSRFTGRLALALRHRYDLVGDPRDLDRAQRIMASTISIIHPDAPDFTGWKLETAVLMGYDEASVEEASNVFAQVAEAEPPRSAVRVRALGLRGRSAWSIYRSAPTGHGRPWLDVAVSALSGAIAESTTVPEGLRKELAAALLARYLESDARGPDAGAAAEVLAPVAEGSPATRLLNALAPELGGPDTVLVDLGIWALTRMADDPGAKSVADRLDFLASLVSDHTPGLNPARRLDVRIGLLRAALKLGDSSKAPRRGNDLAVAHQERFLEGGDHNDLDVAIRQATIATEHPNALARDRVTALNTLGAALMRSYEATGDLGVFLQALVALERAANDSPGVVPIPERVQTLSNLVSALRIGADRRIKGVDLTTAEKRAHEAVKIAIDSQSGDETAAVAFAIRGSVHHERWRQGKAVSNLDLAIADWRKVLTLDVPLLRAVTSLNLGGALLSSGDTDEALPLLFFAVRHLDRHLPDRALAAGRIAEALHIRATADSPHAERYRAQATSWSARAVRWARQTSAETLLSVAWDWGVRAHQQDDWQSMATAYTAAIDGLRNLFAVNGQVAAKENWAREGFGVATRAAFALTKCGQPNQAVMALERARALLLLDTLHGKAKETTSIEASYEELRLALRYQLVYFVPGPSGGVALIVDPKSDQAVSVSLPELTERAAGGRVRAFRSAAAAASANPRAWSRTLKRTCIWLAQQIAPVVSQLAPGPVTLVPTGALVFLPLHAAHALDGEQNLFDDHVVEYAPAALPLVSGRLPPWADGVERMLAVVNPAPSVETPLVFAPEEAEVAALTAQSLTVLDNFQATAEAVRAALPEHSRLHFACHGKAEISNPRMSGIILSGDRRLTLHDLAEADLSHVRMVFLSACETGVAGADAPDEVLTLGSAFLAAGADGVVSSLWQVPDLATLVLVALFYDRLAETLDPAVALHDAQRFMRTETNDAMLTRLTGLRRRGRLPSSTHDLLAMELSASSSQQRLFEDPDSWAGFVFSGFATN